MPLSVKSGIYAMSKGILENLKLIHKIQPVIKDEHRDYETELNEEKDSNCQSREELMSSSEPYPKNDKDLNMIIVDNNNEIEAMKTKTEDIIAHPSNYKGCDEEGSLIYDQGDVLNNRYKILGQLGKGAFGQVFKVMDMSENNKLVALKIVKNTEEFRKFARLEINVLEKLAEKSEGNPHCIQLLRWFDYHGHIGMVFEMLGQSVFDFLKSNNFKPFPLKQIREIASQLIKAVNFLHENNLTHTDLKPENVLFVDSSSTCHGNNKNQKSNKKVLFKTDIKVIDFGMAVFDHEKHQDLVSTRYYRAPEVIMTLGWGQPCDVWSLGCMIFEMAFGKVLFQTLFDQEHLAMMERILGPIPQSMGKKCHNKQFFDSHGNFQWVDKNSPLDRYVRKHCQPLYKYRCSSLESKSGGLLLDLITKMLQYEPDKRITLKEAMKHNFFTDF